MSLDQAFLFLLSKQSRPMQLMRKGTGGFAATNVEAAISNYHRNLEMPSNIIEKGREFVIAKKSLTLAALPNPKRGDFLIDAEMGTMAITEVNEMIVLGNILAFRVRTG